MKQGVLFGELSLTKVGVGSRRNFHCLDVYTSVWMKHVYLLFYWLAMSNCCANPIVYYWMNKRYRLVVQLN